MNRGLIILSTVCLLILSCIEPTHDNRYDPDNPAKAYLAGTVYGFDDNELDGATVSLIKDSAVVYETQTSNGGWYEFQRVDPGIYILEAGANLYTPVQMTAELPADTEAYIDLYLQEIYFDFENDAVGVDEPERFHIESGEWSVMQDPADPEDHSVPNVYRGIAEHNTAPVAISIIEGVVTDFSIEAKLKIFNETTSNWSAGLVLRYQDPANYYLLRIAEGYIKLSKMVNGAEIYLAETDTLFFNIDQWYCLYACFEGQHIKIFFEGDLFFELDDDAFSDGSPGLWVQSYDPGGGAIVYFDDIKLWP